MSYLSVISLEAAKRHLGIDDDSRDLELIRMIKSALTYVEKHSNHLLYPRVVRYFYTGSKVRIFDHPINSLVYPDPNTTIRTVRALYSIYQDQNAENEYLELNVGYQSAGDIPPALQEAALMLLEHFFNMKETGSSQVPQLALELIRSEARCTI